LNNLKGNIDVYSVSLSDQAKAFFEDATAKLQRRLDRCFEQLKTNPNLHPNIKSLKGKLAGCNRYQIGNYRVVYMIDEQTEQVFVNTIAHRHKVYKK